MDSWSGLKIETQELRDVCERLIDHLERTQGESVTLREDYFYSLPSPGVYDVTRDPPEPTIGQLTETWDNLHRNRDADSTIAFELVWLGDLLRALGHSGLNAP